MANLLIAEDDGSSNEAGPVKITHRFDGTTLVLIMHNQDPEHPGQRLELSITPEECHTDQGLSLFIGAVQEAFDRTDDEIDRGIYKAAARKLRGDAAERAIGKSPLLAMGYTPTFKFEIGDRVWRTSPAGPVACTIGGRFCRDGQNRYTLVGQTHTWEYPEFNFQARK